MTAQQDAVPAMSLPSDLTPKQLQQFHNIDRQAFARLVARLRFDPFLSMKIVAFWNLLERIGFKNFVKSLQLLSDALLLSLAKEAIACLECLYCSTQQFDSWVEIDLPVMRELVGQEIYLSYLFKERESAKRMIDGFVQYVCQIAFSDIVLSDLDDKQSSKSRSASECQTTSLRVDDVELSGQEKVSVLTEDVESRVDAEDRTLFLTFSRGHPVSYQELNGFIARRFGKCVEAVYMERKPQPLFACLVLKSLSDMSMILGSKKLVKFLINGKQVRARRFVPKTMKQSQCTTPIATGFPIDAA